MRFLIMSGSRDDHPFARLLDRLPFFVAAALAVSACAYVLVLLLASVSDDFDYSVISEEERVASVKCVPEVDDSVLTIPAAVGPFWRSYKVVGIESHAFENDESFARLELPDGLRSIGYGTFYGCRRLRSLSLPRSVEEIGDGAFYGCSSLSEVTLSPDMKSMGEYVFERCTGLRRVVVPEGVKVMPRSVFCACSSLSELDLPSSLVSIEPLAFKDCVSLVDVELPLGVRDVGGCSFEMCTSLRRVVIPPLVKGLGVTAFNGCSSLSEVVCLAVEPPPLGSSVFDGISQDAVLFVPAGSADAYRLSPWADYFSAVKEF